MAHPPEAPWQTSFLVPNLHCPTCVSHIIALMDDFEPPPVVQNISIINHIVTVAHAHTVSATAIGDALETSGFEVFHIIPDPRTNEELSPLPGRDVHLEDAVQRWDAKQHPDVDEATRLLHEAKCQMCASYGATVRGWGDFEGVVVSDCDTQTPTYRATLLIDGMTCSSCVANVSNALRNVKSVLTVDVSLLGHNANVKFRSDDADATARELTQVIDDAGYDAQLLDFKDITPKADRDMARGKSDSWEATIAIEGMSRSSCVEKISSAIKHLSFVQQADVSLIAHSASVIFDGESHKSLLLDAIERTGCKPTLVQLRPVEKELTSARKVSLQIDGMHCAQCPKRVLDAARRAGASLEKTPTLESPILTITYIPDAPKLTLRRIINDISALDHSFTVRVHAASSMEQRSRDMLKKEQRAILLRALLAIVAAIPSLIIGVVYMNLVSEDDPGYVYLMHSLHGISRAEWANFIIATPVYFFAADYFHRRTLKEIYALWRRRSTVPIAKRLYRFGSMNMLISLGTTIAYFASLAELIVAASNPARHMDDGFKPTYFDSVVFLTMFLLLGRSAEAHMKAKSGDAIAALGRLRPEEASLVIPAGKCGTSTIERVNTDLIDVGDVIKIAHGSSPPCDGVLLDGFALFDESSLTGESRVVSKRAGDKTFSGTINKGQAVDITVTNPAGASMLDSIIQIVREGQSKRAPMERIADLLTAYFVPAVVVIAIVTWIIWLSLGLSGSLPTDYLDSNTGGWAFWSLQFAIAVFVIACPCGLGLAAPTALFVGGGLAAQHGILVKGGGEAFQEASNLDAVVFDKTGTLTEGATPKIMQHQIYGNIAGLGRLAVLGMLKRVEENSSHPLARAAISFATSEGADDGVFVTAIEEIAGKGLKAMIQISSDKYEGRYEALVGNEALLEDNDVEVTEDAADTLEAWKSMGHSIILLACRIPVEEKWHLSAIFAASDPLRPEAATVVKHLQANGLDVWMLSGDNPRTAQSVGAQVGIPSEQIIAGVLPGQKADKVRYLQRALTPKRGRGFHDALLASNRTRATIAVVGDGINDAPALAAADVGIAVASGSDVAVQSASFVLVQSDLRAVLTLARLSRIVFRRIVLNFFWAVLYNLIALPVAAGVLYPVKTDGGSHIRLDPAWAALAMALSSISVVTSSLLLRTRILGIGFRG